jgi:hypothetical protein
MRRAIAIPIRRSSTQRAGENQHQFPVAYATEDNASEEDREADVAAARAGLGRGQRRPDEQLDRAIFTRAASDHQR